MYSVPLLWLTTLVMWLLLAQQVWGQVELPRVEFATPVGVKVAIIIATSIWYGLWG